MTERRRNPSEGEIDEWDPDLGLSDASCCGIRNIILISSPYDYFLLEEEGRLTDLFKKVYLQRDKGYIPQIRRFGTGKEALERMNGGWVDLLVIFNHPPDMDIPRIAEEAKERSPDTPVVLLANNTPELKRISESPDSRVLDGIFTWNGVAEIFLGIVQLIEDRVGAEETGLKDVILLAQDDITGYSIYISRIYQRIWLHMEDVLKSRFGKREKELRRSRRPRLVLAEGPEKAEKCIRDLGGRLLMAVLDRTGEEKWDYVERDLSEKRIPLMVIDSEERNIDQYPEKIRVPSDRTSLEADLLDFIGKNLRSGELRIRDSEGKVIARATDLISLERGVIKSPDDVLDAYLRFGHIIGWLEGRGDLELANEMKSIAESNLSGLELRREVLRSIDRRKRSMTDRENGVFRKGGVTRLGNGAMGGKARGIAFMNKVFRKDMEVHPFGGLEISIPGTLVICTDVFEDFLRMNNLIREELLSSSDERIAEAFLKADLPSTTLGKLRNLVEEYRGPLAVRSSSVLEDALFQPFAGVYASMMLSNSSLETDVRFRNLTNAIKYVYASTFFEGARSYIETTPNRIEDERMGVIIQEVTGEEHGDYYYPAISGVARSYDFWPFGRCSNEDGTASLALGLGKIIVDGGASFRFCPAHPGVPYYGDTRELMEISQKHFYALRRGKRVSSVNLDEDSTLTRLDLGRAEKDGVLDLVASTYSPENDRLYPGTGRDGPRVVDFGPILKNREVDLPDLIKHILDKSERALGFPVEIEFAVNRKREKTIFSLLQVRSMVASGGGEEITGKDLESGRRILRSDEVLGHGTTGCIEDIVYVERNLDMAGSRAAAAEVKGMNKKLKDEGRPYILIGPGRWGSTDPWLGIPVIWSDISGVKVVVETPVNHRRIDPSQGSHFFHNLSSLRIGYFTVKPSAEEEVDWDWLEELEVVERGKHTRHLKSDKPLKAVIDGKNGVGALLVDERQKCNQ